MSMWESQPVRLPPPPAHARTSAVSCSPNRPPRPPQAHWLGFSPDSQKISCPTCIRVQRRRRRFRAQSSAGWNRSARRHHPTRNSNRNHGRCLSRSRRNRSYRTVLPPCWRPAADQCLARCRRRQRAFSLLCRGKRRLSRACRWPKRLSRPSSPPGFPKRRLSCGSASTGSPLPPPPPPHCSAV